VTSPALTPIEDIRSDDDESTLQLRELAAKARDYVSSFDWCLPIDAMYLADGVGRIIGLFLIEFSGKIGGTDERLWVVAGDIPSAYMIVEPPAAANDALETYCEMMGDWANAVLVTHDFDNVFPVDAAPTPGNATLLRKRVEFIREEIIPSAPDQSIDSPL
jgi:hypothetical protein